MSQRQDRPITVRMAAKLVFGTSEPSVIQVARLQQHLESGLLKGTRTGRSDERWVTTPACVAEYLANIAAHRHKAPDQERRLSTSASTISPGQQPRRAPRGANEELRRAYQGVLKDYFLAVIFRRREPNTTKWFQCSVAAGQVGLLVATIALVVVSTKSIFFHKPPPEQVVVEEWLETNVGEYVVRKWFPSENLPAVGRTRVRVQYRYRNARGGHIETDRVFAIEQGKVVRVDSDVVP